MTKKQLAFILVSTIFILGCVGFYGYRLIHYYRIEHPKGAPVKYEKLYDRLLLNYDSSDGLYKDQDAYYFKGNIENNYVSYSGRIWRIISLDEEHNIKLITEDAQTLLSYGDGYENSYVHKWLNMDIEDETHESFYGTLNSNNLIYSSVYIDQIDDVENITHNKIYDDIVGLLSLYEYNKAGGKNSFLNNDGEWWLSTTTSDGKAWYVLKDSVSKVDYTTFANKGVRPVVSLNYNAVITGGTGAKEDPFKIEEKTITKLSELYVGEKITFNDKTWKVMKQDSDKTKVVLDGLIETKKLFSNTTNVFDLQDSNGLANYLNNTFYKSLDNKEFIKEGTFTNGSYGIDLDYNYETIKESEITANVGILAIGDMFISDYADVFLMNHSNSSKLVYTISNENIIYEDDITNPKDIRPVLYLDNELIISSGDGFKAPYTIGGVPNEE